MLSQPESVGLLGYCAITMGPICFSRSTSISCSATPTSSATPSTTASSAPDTHPEAPSQAPGQSGPTRHPRVLLPELPSAPARHLQPEAAPVRVVVVVGHRRLQRHRRPRRSQRRKSRRQLSAVLRPRGLGGMAAQDFGQLKNLGDVWIRTSTLSCFLLSYCILAGPPVLG